MFDRIRETIENNLEEIKEKETELREAQNEIEEALDELSMARANLESLIDAVDNMGTSVSVNVSLDLDF